MAATLNIDLNILRRNAERLVRLGDDNGLSLALVTKVFCGDPTVVAALEPVPFGWLADSRLDNIARYPDTAKKKMLLRPPGLSEIVRTVALCDVSLNSERAVLELLAAEAARAGKVHGVLLMIDMGDLREGIFYTRRDEILETAHFAHEHPHLDLLGVGVNLTCYASILPTPENLGGLCDIADFLRRELNAALPVVSGGNSSSVYLIPRGELPKGITNLRIGEAWMRGVEAAFNERFMAQETDAVTLDVEIVEIQDKPSLPVGSPGITTYGESPVFEDKGIRRRAILSIGRQDVDHEGLFPEDGAVTILGASSDHMIVDLTDSARTYRLGDSLRFRMSYTAIMRCCTSSFIRRNYL